MADFITQFAANEGVNRENFNSRIAQANTALSNKAPAGYGLGTAAKNISNQDLLVYMRANQSGWYRGQNVENAPSSAWYYFNIIADSPTYATVTAYRYADNYAVPISTAYLQNDSWSGWTQTATAKPPAKYVLPLASGVTGGTTYYFKTQEGMVFVYFSAQKSGGATWADQDLVATLPAGFRPSHNVQQSVMGDDVPAITTKRQPVMAYVASNGEIRLTTLKTTWADCKMVSGWLAFLAGV